MKRVALVLSALAATNAASAQVVTDGSLGPATTLPGPAVTIPANLGQTRGGNLFHSFTRLDIAAGESVTFQGPDAVQHVLARVTGGSPTNVNGLLRCEIPGADLYLINPAGVVIGPAGTLEVRGSFYVANAAYVRLGADGRFDARVVADSVLSTSAPSAFGFAASPSAPSPGSSDVLVRGNLGVEAGNGVSVVAGGTLRIVGGELLAESGAINVAAVRAGEVALVETARGVVIDTAATADPRGDIEISGDGIVDATGPTPGVVTIRGGTLRMGDARVVSSATAGAANTDPHRAVDVRLSGTLNIDPGAAIFALASGDGAGGSVRIVTGGDVTVDGGARPGTNGVATRSAGAGPAGAVEISTPAAVRITNGGDIGSTSEGPGRGGDVTLFASSLEVTAGGQLFAQARAAGAGGDVNIQTIGAVELSGAGSSILTATARGTAGRGGDIDIDASQLVVSDLAFVSATTNGGGDAGNIRIAATNVELDGLGKDGFTGVGANTQPDPGVTPGAGGSVFITSDSLVIRDGAGVAARAFGGTDGGRIDLTVTGELLIDATRTGAQTGLTAQADGTANGGSIAARAESVELRRGQITASAAADGGEIDILAPGRVRLRQSEISAEAGGTGGNIAVERPQSVILDRSRITANAVRGNGGNITIRAESFIPSAGPETAVTASSEFALAGNIEINSPDTEIAGALVRLSGDFAVPEAQLQPLCGATLGGNVSSFVATGRGGAPAAPAGWQPAFPIAVPGR